MKKMTPEETSDFVVAVRDMQSFCRELERLQQKGIGSHTFALTLHKLDEIRRISQWVNELSDAVYITLEEYGEENVQEQVKDYPLMNVPE